MDIKPSLPVIPFQNHDNTIFEVAKYSDPTNKIKRVENTERMMKERSEEYRQETAYAYHPHNSSKYRPGETVDFVIA